MRVEREGACSAKCRGGRYEVLDCFLLPYFLALTVYRQHPSQRGKLSVLALGSRRLSLSNGLSLRGDGMEKKDAGAVAPAMLPLPTARGRVTPSSRRGPRALRRMDLRKTAFSGL